MAVTFMTGFESRHTLTDGWVLTGSGSDLLNNSTNPRSGGWALRISVATGVAGNMTVTAGNYVHFGFRLWSASTLTTTRLMFGAIAAGTINVRVTSSRTLEVYLNTTLIGTSAALANDTWYWLGIRQVTGTSVAFLQIDGADSVTGTATVSATSGVIGFPGTEATAAAAYVDDVIVDGAGFLASSKVIDLLPTADSARSAGWVGGAGGTTNLWDAVNNQPPVGVADTGTNASQDRNATAEANGSYDATLQTYTVGGVGTGDTLLAVQNVISTAAPVTTSSKQGTVGNVSNPAITNIALGAGGTAGAFWSGVAGGTFPTGWKASFGTLTTSPSVTLGTAPVMRVTQVTSSTRIAMVCYMSLRIAWTPAVAAAVPQSIVNQSILAQ